MEQTRRRGVNLPNGSTVIADDPELGSSYVAKIVDNRASLLPGWARVRVLEVLRYPRQTAISDAGIPTENPPLSYGEEDCLYIIGTATAEGGKERYAASNRQALREALDRAKEAEPAGLAILERHEQGNVKRAPIRGHKKRRKRK